MSSQRLPLRPKKSSGLYATADVADPGIKDDEWYTQEIIVTGRHIVLKINGKTMTDYTEPENKSAFSGEFERRLGEARLHCRPRSQKRGLLQKHCRQTTTLTPATLTLFCSLFAQRGVNCFVNQRHLTSRRAAGRTACRVGWLLSHSQPGWQPGLRWPPQVSRISEAHGWRLTQAPPGRR